MKIEPMTEKYREPVLEMMRVFYASPAVSTNGSEEIFRADVDRCLREDPYLEGFVLTENGGAVGYAMLAKSYSTEFGKPCIWIEDLYLASGYRDRGYGSVFLRYAAERYPEAILRLEVESENSRAIHTYRKNGFEELPYMEMKR